MEDTLNKVRTILIIGTVINIGLIIFKKLLATKECSCEERVRNTYIAIASLILLRKLQDELIEAAKRVQQERQLAEIERQLEQQFQEIDFQILNVQAIPEVLQDVVKFKYPLAIIKKIELLNDDKGQCVEEIVTIVNKPQISGRSFLEDKTQPQIPTLNQASASTNWDNNFDNQVNQQWLSGNSYWTITPGAGGN